MTSRVALVSVLVGASCGAPGTIRLYARCDGASTVASDLHQYAIIAKGAGHAELRVAGSELPMYVHSWDGATILVGRHKPELRQSISWGEAVPPEAVVILLALFSDKELVAAGLPELAALVETR